MHIISNIALISINETMFVQLISFLIFLFVINRIMFRPLLAEMTKRDNYINKIESDIVGAKDELEGITKQLNQREIVNRSETFTERTELVAKGSRDASIILVEARNKIADLRKKAEDEVNAEILIAQKSIKKESEALVVTIIEKMLDRRPAI